MEEQSLAPLPPVAEASAVILAAAGGALPITTLIKSLFYFDLYALRDLAKQPTQATYIALKAGPVVASYERRIIKALERAGVAQQDEGEDGVSKPVSLISEYAPVLLTQDEITMAETVARWAAQRSASKLSEFSHANVGWKLAWEAGLGAKKPAVNVNLRIAMQQILHSDPWVKQASSEEVRSVLSGADTAECIVH